VKAEKSTFDKLLLNALRELKCTSIGNLVCGRLCRVRDAVRRQSSTTLDLYQPSMKYAAVSTPRQTRNLDVFFITVPLLFTF